MKSLTIGGAARQAGVNVETIRFYERRGLIEQPPKPDRAFRRYSLEIVRRVRFIREAQELGFSLREISDLLELRADASANCDDVRQQALTKRMDVQNKIRKLVRIEKALEQLIASCPKEGKLANCPIIAALDNEQAATDSS